MKRGRNKNCELQTQIKQIFHIKAREREGEEEEGKKSEIMWMYESKKRGRGREREKGTKRGSGAFGNRNFPVLTRTVSGFSCLFFHSILYVFVAWLLAAAAAAVAATAVAASTTKTKNPGWSCWQWLHFHSRTIPGNSSIPSQ